MAAIFRVFAVMIGCLVLANSRNDDYFRVLFLGQSGNGKSTAIKHVFGVNSVPIKHSYASDTSNVGSYISNKFMIDDKLLELFDTPGFFDNSHGLSNDQILELIEIELESIETSNSDSDIDAFVMICGTRTITGRRDYCVDHIRDYLSLFQESMLESLVIIVNYEASEPGSEILERQGYIKGLLRGNIENCNNCDKSIEIPIVSMDCKHPSNEKISQLQNILKNNVKPYKLNRLNDAREHISLIYDEIMNDPENYKDEINYIIKNSTISLPKQVLQRVVENMDGKQCFTTGGSILGVISWNDVECQTVSTPMNKDVVVTIEEEQLIQTTEEKITQVLKNEPTVYWQLAKKMYKDKVYQQFKKQ